MSDTPPDLHLPNLHKCWICDRTADPFDDLEVMCLPEGHLVDRREAWPTKLERLPRSAPAITYCMLLNVNNS